MKRYVYSLSTVVLLAGGMPAFAQFTPPVNGYFAGGYTVATGEAANFVNNGWNVGTGVQWRPHPGPISLRVDVEYSRNDATNQLLTEGTTSNKTQIDHGWTDLFSTDLDAIVDIPLSRRMKLYVLGGGGGAVRRISLTRTVASGGTYCNDWAGLCDAGGYPGDVLVNSKTTGRWEWNAGLGVDISLGDGGQSLFVEARYMEIETPVPTGFVPIRVGLKL